MPPLGDGSPFDDFDPLFSGAFPPGAVPPSVPKVDEKGVAWNAKEFNGKLYLPAEEVVELLESNGLLPKMQAALNRHIERMKNG